MRIFKIFFSILCVGFSFCTESIIVENSPSITIQPSDTLIVHVDSCENRLSTLRSLIGCPQFAAGTMNEIPISGTADVNQRDLLGPDYSAVFIRSFTQETGYAMELVLTFNGTPENGLVYPLTTDGDNLVGTSVVDPDSVYITMALWLASAEFYPGIFYKFAPGLLNQVRIDSSSYTIYDGEPVTDHFGALDATLILNQTEYIQENVQSYLEMGFCVPDTIFLRDICFDARTRDVNGPCRRKAGR